MREKVIQIKRVQADDQVFIDMADGADNPCTSCGVCCTHYRVSFHWSELAGFSGGTVPAELTSQVTPHIACMKGTEAGGGRCTALRGTIGQPGIGCDIYHNRPSVCRVFEVWSEDGTPNPECQRLRGAAGLPLLAPQIA